MRLVRLLAALVVWLALLGLRAWYSVVLTFVGLAVLRATWPAYREGETVTAVFTGVCGVALLSASFWLFHRAARQIGDLSSRRGARNDSHD